MSRFCLDCGNHTEICICNDVSDSQSVEKVVKIFPDLRKYDKVTMVVRFREGHPRTFLEEILRKLKKFFSTGGTVKRDTIEVRTDRLEDMRRIFVQEGFRVEN